MTASAPETVAAAVASRLLDYWEIEGVVDRIVIDQDGCTIDIVDHAWAGEKSRPIATVHLSSMPDWARVGDRCVVRVGR